MPVDLRQNQLLSRALERAPSLAAGMYSGRLTAGQELFQPGQDQDRVYFPITSVVAQVVVLSDGSRVETLSVGREGAVGRQLISVPGQEMTVEFGGDVVTMDQRELMAEAKVNAALEELLQQYQWTTFGALALRTACFAAHRPTARLATWILVMNFRVGSLVSITHERLSQLLATRRATVSVGLEELQDRGAVSLGRGRVLATDGKRLREVACECYDSLATWWLPEGAVRTA